MISIKIHLTYIVASYIDIDIGMRAMRRMKKQGIDVYEDFNSDHTELLLRVKDRKNKQKAIEYHEDRAKKHVQDDFVANYFRTRIGKKRKRRQRRRRQSLYGN